MVDHDDELQEGPINADEKVADETLLADEDEEDVGEEDDALLKSGFTTDEEEADSF